MLMKEFLKLCSDDRSSDPSSAGYVGKHPQGTRVEYGVTRDSATKLQSKCLNASASVPATMVFDHHLTSSAMVYSTNKKYD